MSRRTELVRLRARLLEEIRAFFSARGFVEVSTPLLWPTADPALYVESLRTSTTLPNGQRLELYLPTSPEFFMKRLLAEGLERIYQVCPFFRADELGPLHHPHFTGLEWYQTGVDLPGLMNFVEELVCHCARCLEKEIHESGLRLAFEQRRPFGRLSLHEACRVLGGVELPADFDPAGVRRALSQNGLRFSSNDLAEDLINRLLIERVEPALKKLGAVFVYHYPHYMAALARLNPQQPWLAERAELYLAGMEIANGYHELGDAQEQRRRFEEQIELRQRTGRHAPPLDHDFLAALQSSFPDCSGCALGVDRLLMALCGLTSIEEALSFSLHRFISNPA